MKTFRIRAYGRGGIRILHMFCADPVRLGKAVEQQCDLVLAGGSTTLLLLDQVEVNFSREGLEVISESSWGEAVNVG